MTPATATLPVLTADDYAITDGVSRAIEALAAARRLSATSVLTTMPGWPAAASRIKPLRENVAIGLHLNLTLGAPAAPMPRLAPQGTLPPLAAVIRQTLLRHVSPDELSAEIDRQLDLFEGHLGFPPDHVDGHQHVHVLPVVRTVLLARLAGRYRRSRLLLRDPSVHPWRAAEPSLAAVKALTVDALAFGFAARARKAGFPINTGFAGFSGFDTSQPYATEIERELASAGRRHGCAVIMCHPGFTDPALAALDPVVGRRQQEYDTLMQLPALPERIWHPSRRADGPPPDWREEAAA